jgi:hypothetical protein
MPFGPAEPPNVSKEPYAAIEISLPTPPPDGPSKESADVTDRPRFWLRSGPDPRG